MPNDWLRGAYPALDVARAPLQGPSLADLNDHRHPHWHALLSWQQQIAPGVGPRAEATLFLGQALFFITISLMEQAFAGGLPLAASPADVSIQLSPLANGGLTPCVHLQHRAIRSPATTETYEDLARPLVEGLSGRTGLGAAALWRVAADGIALGLLDLARKRGDMHRAEHLFETLLKQPGSPLCNRHLQWPVEGQGGILQRGGCCRIYQSGDLPLCPGCVLLTKKKGRDISRSPL